MQKSGNGTTRHSWPQATTPARMPAIPGGPRSVPWGARPSSRPMLLGGAVGHEQELEPAPCRIKRLDPNWSPVPFCVGSPAMTRRGQRTLCLLVSLMSTLPLLLPSRVQARPLTAFELTITGIDLTVGPATQQVPKGVTSTVTTQLTIPHASIPIE